MRSNMGSHMEVAKPAIFNGEAGKIGGFIMVCMLQLKDLRVGQWEEPCIGLTQENSIESSCTE